MFEFMSKQSSRPESMRSLAYGFVLVLVPAVVVDLSRRLHSDWVERLTLPVLTPWVLWLLWLFYVWQRPWSFGRRERRRLANPAEILNTPQGVKKPENYDGCKPLHEAQWKYINRAVEAQGRYFGNGILAALLPPLALLLLSIQLLALPDGGTWAVGLILTRISHRSSGSVDSEAKVSFAAHF